ncbi:MAG: type II CRISPR-associated endonuclease Cas1 [Bacteroidales bacterium]|nr:type II CRISPR-associated endonuclease Cas1 [Bacteroidales bacterium]
MIKRTLYISDSYHLSLKNRQLILSLKRDEKVRTVPVEDIGYLVLDHPQISFTMKLVEELSENNVATVFCDSRHMPSSMVLPLESHHIQSELFRSQIEATEPLKKNLWKQIVERKIHNQALLLRKKGKSDRQLTVLARNIKSGDSENREGFAARIYWSAMLGKDFMRDRYGKPPNMYLNYGYILLRSAVARALTGSGLLPTLGIHHRNRYNAFCLADDIMEPYRPYVDEISIDLFDKYPDAVILEKEHKKELLQLMSIDVRVENNKRPLMIALTHTTASLARCFTGDGRKLVLPTFE